jgi:hypothetical protein
MHKRFSSIEHIRNAILETFAGVMGPRRWVPDMPDIQELLDEQYPEAAGNPENIPDDEIEMFIRRTVTSLLRAWKRSTPGVLKDLHDPRTNLN